MNLELTNGQRVVTMDYIYISGEGTNAEYQRANTECTALWNGTPENLPENGITYNFKNGGKITVTETLTPGTVSVSIYDNNDNLVHSISSSQDALFYLTFNNYHSGAYEPEELGLRTCAIATEIYNVSDVPYPTQDNSPVMVEMLGRGYHNEGYNDPEVMATFVGVCVNSFNANYLAIMEGSIVPADPYGEGGTSGTGGGTGTFSGTGDAIAIPSLPTLSAVDAGFITLFNPSIAQLGTLASYMWSGLFDIDGWRKIFADPMNAILGLSIVPVNVPSGGAKEVKVGNISTGVMMTVAGSQYVSVDCGTIDVKEYWGAYLDYDPYTKAEIYLPYIGTHALAVDDIMGKSVHVVYHVDVLSGACCAYVQCGGTVLYTFIGQCSSSIPITGDNWTNVINGAISIAGSIGSMVATGGASAPMEIGNIASTAINTMKPSVEKSGAMGGTGGMMGVQTPYLILTRPRQALPARQNTFTGYPSFITEKLSTLSGYTEVFKIHLENVPATEQELSEIETLLKSGVIF